MKFFDARMSGWLLPSLLIAWTISIPETWSKSPANSARPTSGSSAAQILTPAPVPVVTATSGHYGVQAIKFSPNGRFLATAGSPGEIKLWDIGSARLLRTMKQEETLIYGIAVSPDSRQVISSDSNSLKIWDAATGLLQRTISIKGGHPLVLSSDGRLIFSSDDYHLIRSFDVVTGATKQTFRAPIIEKRNSHFLSISLSPDGKLLAAGESGITKCECAIAIWDTANGRLIRTIDAHRGAIRSLAFSPDSRTLLSGSGDKTIKLWDVSTGQLQRTLEGHTSDVSSVLFLGDGRRVASAGWQDDVRVWDVATAQVISTLSQAPNANSLALSPDGQSIASGRWGTVIQSDLATGRVLRAFRSPLGDGQRYAQSVFYLSGGQWAAAYGADLSRWDARTGELLKVTETNGSGRWAIANGVSSFATFATGTAANLWDYSEEKTLMTFEVNRGETDHQIVSLAVSSDGRWIASANYKEANVTIWDTANAQSIRSIEAVNVRTGTFYVHAIAFSPDGQLLATAGGPDKGIRVWDVATGKLRATIGADDTRLLRFSADGRRILGGGYDEAHAGASVKLWDAYSGQLIQQFKHGFTVDGIAISNDGRYVVATGGLNSGTNLFDVASGNLIRALVGNTGSGTAISFSSNGEQIAFASNIGTLTVWQRETGKLLTTSIRSETGDWVTITPEGFFVASEHGAELLYVVRGFEIAGIDQFYQSLYRPDLVREKLSGDPRGLVREAEARLDLNKAIASGSAPDVRLTLPGRALSSMANDQVSVEAEITDHGGGVGRVEWRVNGITAGIDNPAPAAAGQPLRLTRSLALDAGDNTIEVVAYNSANLIASVPGRVSVAAQTAAPAPSPAPAPGPTTTAPAPMPAPVIAAAPRLFVLAAGSDNYADKRFQLQYSVPDAKAMAQALVDSGKGLYASVEVKVMSDAEVVTDKLDAAFAELSGKIQPTDVFVLYLAGHGKTVDARYYFVPQNFAVDGEATAVKIDAAVRAQGISQEQWQRWFAAIPARKSVILFDTCESGTLTGDATETKTLERGAANDRLAQATGRSIITASSGSTDAFEGYHGHGLFTYNLLDALDKGDGDNSGTIEVTELAAYVYSQVTSISEKVFKKRQEPQIKITLNYPLTRQAHVLQDDATPVAEARPAYQVAQVAQLQIKPGSGATVVRSLSAKTAVTVLKSDGGWSLIASEGRPLGYVATRDLTPMQ